MRSVCGSTAASPFLPFLPFLPLASSPLAISHPSAAHPGDPLALLGERGQTLAVGVGDLHELHADEALGRAAHHTAGAVDPRHARAQLEDEAQVLADRGL